MKTLLALLLVLASCGERASLPDQGPTRTIVAAEGVEVAVPERATRVLPANSAMMDLVVALCDPDRIVAVPEPAFHWSVIAEDPQPWKGKPDFDRFTTESVLSLEPDLVLISSWTEDGPVKRLRELGVAVVEVPDADTWEELIEGIEIVAAALGEQERASSFVAGLEDRKRDLAKKHSQPRRVMPYANFGGGGFTSGEGTTLDLAIELAGHRNASAEADILRHKEITLEEVLLIEPDLFLTGSSRDGVAAGATFLRSEGALSDLKAIQDDRILTISPELFSASSYRILDAAEAVADEIERLYGTD